MLWLKACPRCHGDVVLERDSRTIYLECVQCGHILSAAQERALGVHTSAHYLTHLSPTSHSQMAGTLGTASSDTRYASTGP